MNTKPLSIILYVQHKKIKNGSESLQVLFGERKWESGQTQLQ